MKMLKNNNKKKNGSWLCWESAAKQSCRSLRAVGGEEDGWQRERGGGGGIKASF